MEINTIEDVNKISRKTTKYVEFKLNFLKAIENDNWGKKFNGLLSDCGCNSGQKFMFYFFPMLLVFVLLLFIYGSLSNFNIIIIFIVANIVAGIIGKIVGIRRRNIRIKKLIVYFYQEIEIIPTQETVNNV